ncbi:MAG: FHA domain-containing protein [Planctomycetes bacterium]|nr:FHA domain-containing protein [Planctomycetota bacterium]
MADSSTASSSTSTKSAEPFLVVMDGTRCEITQLKRRRIYCIGRSGKCEIVVAHEKSSRRHCEVFYRNRKWYIRDLESRNGTRLNGEKIIGEDLLEHGDLVQVAKTRIMFTNELTDAESSMGSFTSDLLARDTEVGQRDQATELDMPALSDPDTDEK